MRIVRCTSWMELPSDDDDGKGSAQSRSFPSQSACRRSNLYDLHHEMPRKIKELAEKTASGSVIL